MIRYSKVLKKNKREIVLLKSRPCTWGRCFFCDYISDNCTNEQEMIFFNREILKNITGEFKSLEIINSASVFELPKQSLEDIKDIAISKGIKTLYFESHYMYRKRLDEIREFFKGIQVIFKCGIESFDDSFRNDYLKKGVVFSSPKEVSKYFQSICLMVGIKGQNKEMIRKDIEILQKYFERGCINLYVNNTTQVKEDEELKKWFAREFKHLENEENIEILWQNTDFGVGGENEY